MKKENLFSVTDLGERHLNGLSPSVINKILIGLCLIEDTCEAHDHCLKYIPTKKGMKYGAYFLDRASNIFWRWKRNIVPVIKSDGLKWLEKQYDYLYKSAYKVKQDIGKIKGKEKVSINWGMIDTGKIEFVVEEMGLKLTAKIKTFLDRNNIKTVEGFLSTTQQDILKTYGCGNKTTCEIFKLKKEIKKYKETNGS